MRRLVALPALLLAAACTREATPATSAPTAGAALERAALERGLVVDPARIDPVGVYAAETDRLCLVRRDATGDAYAIGAAVDYGEGQACLARGTATGRGTLDVRLGDGCRFTARIGEDRLRFPAILPAACDRACTGRASLSTLVVDRLSGSASEARAVIAADGRPLCS